MVTTFRQNTGSSDKRFFLHFYNLILFHLNNIKHSNIYTGATSYEINDFHDINNVEEIIFKGLVLLRLITGIPSCSQSKSSSFNE